MSDPSDPAGGTPQTGGARSEGPPPQDMTDVSHVIAYDLEPDEQPGGPDGLKVHYEISVVTGERARELNPRQAAAIWDLLEWASGRRKESGKGQENAHGSTRKAD